MSALEVICESFCDYKQQLQRGLDLGLIEVSFELKEEDRFYRVSRILPHIIANIKLPEEPEIYGLYRKASEFLYQIWGNQDNESKEKWQENFRLLFADQENSQRFRQGFYKILEITLQDTKIKQYEVLDRGYVDELRKIQDKLSTDNLCQQLNKY